jgi:hypothetical protein
MPSAGEGTAAEAHPVLQSEPETAPLRAFGHGAEALGEERDVAVPVAVGVEAAHAGDDPDAERLRRVEHPLVGRRDRAGSGWVEGEVVVSEGGDLHAVASAEPLRLGDSVRVQGRGGRVAERLGSQLDAGEAEPGGLLDIRHIAREKAELHVAVLPPTP